MSRDSQVSSLPQNGWSCESLEQGIIAAAKLAGVSLDHTKLSEALGGLDYIAHGYLA